MQGTVVDVVLTGGAQSDGCNVTVDLAGEHTCFTDTRVVIASNPCRANIPNWAQHLDDAIAVPANRVNLRRVGDLNDAHIVIVGAGLTAAHLACGAVQRGAHVTMVCRAALRERSFDTDPGWLGPKELQRYETIEDPAERLAAARAARGGGTVPPWMLVELRRLADASSLTILNDAEIVGVHRAD
ncbi:NAD-binding protein [Ilumatobacter sp.]|uniref:NAD-binding protein n=1 Tax=Ilumatobacter sp. TaxID=1967498 RepID=UPI0037509AB2